MGSDIQERSPQGYLFKGSSTVLHEAFDSMLLGSTADNLPIVSNVCPGNQVFILNLDNNELLIGYEAASSCELNIDANAWKKCLGASLTENHLQNTKKPHIPLELGSPLPVQFRIRLGSTFHKLSMTESEGTLLRRFSRRDIFNPQSVLLLTDEQVRDISMIAVKSSLNFKEEDFQKHSVSRNISQGTADYVTLSENLYSSLIYKANEDKTVCAPLGKQPIDVDTVLEAPLASFSSSEKSSDSEMDSMIVSPKVKQNDKEDAKNKFCHPTHSRVLLHKIDEGKVEFDKMVNRNIASINETIQIFIYKVEELINSQFHNGHSKAPGERQDLIRHSSGCTSYNFGDTIAICQKLQTLVSAMWSGAMVHVYGSLATGLWLPGHSDIDLSISFCRMVYPVQPLPYSMPPSRNYHQVFYQPSMVFSPPNALSPPLSPEFGERQHFPYGFHSEPRTSGTNGSFQRHEDLKSLRSSGAPNQTPVGYRKGSPVFDDRYAEPLGQPAQTMLGPSMGLVQGHFHFGTPLQHLQPKFPLQPPIPVMIPSVEVLEIDKAQKLIYLNSLYSVMKEQSWLHNVKLIHGGMPVLKIVAASPSMANLGGCQSSSDRMLGIPVDISFRNADHRGLEARDYVAGLIIDFPNLLRPLVLVLKWILYRYGYNDVYHGGLGSYSLTLLVTFFLLRCGFKKSQEYSKIKSPAIATYESNQKGFQSFSSSELKSCGGHESPQSNGRTRPPRSWSSPCISDMKRKGLKKRSNFVSSIESQPRCDIDIPEPDGYYPSRNAYFDEYLGDGNSFMQMYRLNSNKTYEGMNSVANPQDIPPVFSSSYFASLSTSKQLKLEKAQTAIESATRSTRTWLESFIFSEESVRKGLEGLVVGRCLLGILQLYSHPAIGGLDLASVEIDISDCGNIFIPSIPATLSIRDPVNPSNTVGGSSFAIHKVQAKFSELHQQLLTHPEALDSLLRTIENGNTNLDSNDMNIGVDSNSPHSC